LPAEHGVAVQSVRVEYYGWVGRTLGLAKTDGRVFVDLPVGRGETIRSVLQRLAADSEPFRETVFDVDRDRVREYVALLINDRAVELAGGLDTQLRPGDNLLFLPGYSGG
jgi:molybdopterin converting factor small subunit